jgi:hypothetical protein
MADRRFKTREEYEAWKAGTSAEGGAGARQPSRHPERFLSPAATSILILVAIVIAIAFALALRSERAELARLQVIELTALQRQTEWIERTTREMQAVNEPTTALAFKRAGASYEAELKREYDEARRRREDFESHFRARYGWLGF